MRKNSSSWFFKIIFFVIFLSISFNISKILDRKDAFFDNWSELTAFSSFFYKIDFDQYSGIPRVLESIALDNEIIAVENPHSFYKSMILNDMHSPSSDNTYRLYTSNVAIHSTLFAPLFLSPLYEMGLPFSRIVIIVKLLNIFLFSVTASCFIFSLRSYFSHASFIILTILIAGFSTHINLTSKSFYWSIWLYYTPYLMQYFLINSQFYQRFTFKKRVMAISLVAFSTMILFFSFHLETFTASVIAMFLPYILEFNKAPTRKTSKILIAQLLAVIIGSLLALMFVLAIKFLLVSHYFGWQEALAIQRRNVLFRVFSGGNFLFTLKDVITDLLQYDYFGWWGILQIKGKDILLLNMLIYPISLGIMSHYPWLKMRLFNLLTINILLFLAAGSWVILALPHSKVHTPHLQFLVTLFYAIPTILVILEIFKIFWFDRFLKIEEDQSH